ncbi:hypothetical protein Niako_3282 [Niastella koreensis GR20-10]|uniref:Uncharacterized protein n=2 Tax=Niastella koreensis TaxID=354356 RepID=G8TI03_NIAKG|nr:hypothetical protein Niako_3282 [Niastella koreensis GR20-10]
MGSGGNPNIRGCCFTVLHDSDGDWQFLSDDKHSTDNIKIVALEQIILKDKALNGKTVLPTFMVLERNYE